MARHVIFALICLTYLYPLYAQWNALPFWPYLLIGILGIAVAMVVTGIYLYQAAVERTFVVVILCVILIYGVGMVLPSLFRIDTVKAAGGEVLQQTQ